MEPNPRNYRGFTGFGATEIHRDRILDSVLNAILESWVFSHCPAAVRTARIRQLFS